MFNQYNNNNDSDPWSKPPVQKRPRDPNASAMATAAMVFAIISLLTILFSGGSIFFGAMAIIFGLLSRGTPERPVKTSKYAIILGAIALVLSLITTTITLMSIINTYGLDNLIQYYQNIINSGSIVDANQYLQDIMNDTSLYQNL